MLDDGWMPPNLRKLHRLHKLATRLAAFTGFYAGLGMAVFLLGHRSLGLKAGLVASVLGAGWGATRHFTRVVANRMRPPPTR